MHDWLAQLKPLLAHGDAVVLVTVAHTDGSAPRDAGARMLVTRHRALGTVGGGHLEWKAIESARRLLSEAPLSGAPLRQLERLPLGPSLGQCCGGAVVLAYERLTLADLGWVAALHKRDEAGLASLRTTIFPALEADGGSKHPRAPGALPPVHWQAIDDGNALDESIMGIDTDIDAGGPIRASCRLLDPALPSDGMASSPAQQTRPQAPQTQPQQTQPQRTQLLREVLLPDRFHVVLFGAGHVGAALVKILLTLRCTVHWVDTRDTPFPALSATNLTLEHNDAPQEAVDRAPPGSYFLVMTHSHALDQELSNHILRRADFAYFGLIGSLSKRRQFEHRMLARGIAAQQIARMVCPIGIDGIHDKAPDTIAIAVAAQLLQYVERRGMGLAAMTTAAHL